jgi:hypothetical protein
MLKPSIKEANDYVRRSKLFFISPPPATTSSSSSSSSSSSASSPPPPPPPPPPAALGLPKPLSSCQQKMLAALKSELDLGVVGDDDLLSTVKESVPSLWARQIVAVKNRIDELFMMMKKNEKEKGEKKRKKK